MPTYPGISSNAFRHPLDQQSEETLRSVPGFDLLAKNFSEYLYERPQHIYLLGNDIKVGPRQYSTLYGIYRECIRDLDITLEPILYVNQNPDVNSYSLGYEQPYIVLNTGVLDLLTEDEIRVVLANELGHIKCQHGILIQMSMWMMSTVSLIGDLTLGIGKLVTSGLIYAFYEWRRKAELSADRASLLVVDDLNLVLKTLMKCAGGSHKYGHECNLQEFIEQAQEYRQLDQDNLNQFYKVLVYNSGNNVFLTHSFEVERVSYLQEWANSDNYQQIRQGNYPRKGAVEVDMTNSNSEIDTLRQQVEELQAEIERVKSQKN